VWTKILFYEKSQEIRDVAEAEKEWQQNQKSLLNKERDLYLRRRIG
jgi:hypothetical protein